MLSSPLISQKQNGKLLYIKELSAAEKLNNTVKQLLNWICPSLHCTTAWCSLQRATADEVLAELISAANFSNSFIDLLNDF